MAVVTSLKTTVTCNLYGEAIIIIIIMVIRA